MKQWYTIGLMWSVAAPLEAQAPPPPSDTTLQSITARGRLLATYDAVAWRATDALLVGGATPEGVEGFVARPGSPGSWDVLFGQLSASGDSLLLAATVAEPAARGPRQILLHRPAIQGSDANLRAFLAMRTAGRALASAPRPHPGSTQWSPDTFRRTAMCSSC